MGIPHPNFYYRLSEGQIKYDVALLTLETPVDFSNETFSHIRLVNIIVTLITFRPFTPTCAELHQYSRPICLGEEEDLSLNLTERTGAVAGWGTTEVDYAYTQCGYKKGVTRPDSVSRVLKKLLGLR